MRDDLREFARNLRMLRKEKDMDIRTLAKELGIGKTTLSEYENGKIDPSLSMVKKIANYFDEDIDWLVGERNTRRLKKIAERENCRKVGMESKNSANGGVLIYGGKWQDTNDNKGQEI